MPLPLIAALPALAAVASTGINAVSRGLTNARNRKFVVKRYDVERQDNLADWHRQNTYNSPVEARARYEQAGLNPALMYGGGQGGGNAQSVRGTSTGGAEGQAAQLDIGSFFSAKKLGLETKIAKAQIGKLDAETRGISALNRHNKELRDGPDPDDPSFSVMRQVRKENNEYLQQLANQAKTSAETERVKKMVAKADSDLRLIEAQIEELGARNIGKKIIKEILDFAREIYDQTKLKKVITQLIKNAQRAEKQ